MQFDLSFDYRCPFAKNIHLHVVTALRAGADFDINFAPWSLSQGSRSDGAPDVWNDPAYDGDLLSLATGISVRDQQSEYFLNAHEALFRARHDRAIRLVTHDEISNVLAPLGVDMAQVAADVASRRPHDVIAASHKEFDRFDAFGVPTFVVSVFAGVILVKVPAVNVPGISSIFGARAATSKPGVRVSLGPKAPIVVALTRSPCTRTRSPRSSGARTSRYSPM